ncbi:MAG: patatin-like phospholipase family protein [Xanthobacteraceae bacterium]
MKSFALALGAGGARGLAHIAVLEAIDELGVTPTAIAGSSIGAVMAAPYAAGLSGRAIRRHVTSMVHNRAELLRRLLSARAAPWSRFLRAPLGQNPILLDGERLCAAFMPEEMPPGFAGLKIPLLVIASDLATREEIVFTEGPLHPAIAASMAIPGLVRPVEHAGRVLVDGAAVDPLPFTQLYGKADVVVAVDCSAGRIASAHVPDPWDAVFATISLMGQSIVAEKLKSRVPDLLVRPPVAGFRMLEFQKASAIIRAGEHVKDEVKKEVAALLGA